MCLKNRDDFSDRTYWKICTDALLNKGGGA